MIWRFIARWCCPARAFRWAEVDERFIAERLFTPNDIRRAYGMEEK